MLRVASLMSAPLHVSRFLAVQETDNKLVDHVIPVLISTTGVLAVISFQGFFPHYLEGSVEDFS